MDTASTIIVSDNPKEMEAAISRMFRQIDEIREQMKATDADIARLDARYDISKVEMRAMRDETERILARLRGII